MVEENKENKENKKHAMYEGKYFADIEGSGLDKETDQAVLAAVEAKYPASMFKKYWDTHRNWHRESGKSKCLQHAVPQIHFKVVHQKGKDYRLQIFMDAPGKRGYLCTQNAGKITVSIPS